MRNVMVVVTLDSSVMYSEGGLLIAPHPKLNPIIPKA